MLRILAGSACCAKECGRCGGPSCGTLPGGSANCCVGSIVGHKDSCDNYNPPCVFHKAKPATACGDFPAPLATDRPNVLLIGDSISMPVPYTPGGYGLNAKALLTARGMQVAHNGGWGSGGQASNTVKGLLCTNVSTPGNWLNVSGQYEVIHFNFGLHDLVDPGPGEGKEHVPLSAYGANLAEIYRRLSAKAKHVMWTTTTPCPNVTTSMGRTDAKVVAYNAQALTSLTAAAKAAGAKLLVDDLYKAVDDKCGKNYKTCVLQKPKNVHFQPAGCAFMGAEVAKSIEAVIGGEVRMKTEDAAACDSLPAGASSQIAYSHACEVSSSGCLGSPNVFRTSAGTLLATHDHYALNVGHKGEGGAKPGVAYVWASADHAGPWRPVANVSHIYWAEFISAGSDALYLLGTSSDLGGISAVTVSKCLDSPCTGTSWSEASVILPAQDGGRGYHSSGAGAVWSGGRLYRALEMRSALSGCKARGHAVDLSPIMLSAPASCAENLTDAGCWSASPPLCYNASWRLPGGVPLGLGEVRPWEEATVVDTPSGEVKVIMRLDKDGLGQSCHGAVLLDYVPPSAGDAGGGRLVYAATLPSFPSGSSRFTVRRRGGDYFALVNTVDENRTNTGGPPDPCGQRNKLALAMSSDLLEWKICSMVMADDSGLAHTKHIPDASFLLTGFQYVHWQFDGPGERHIIYAVRAAYRGSPDAGQANRYLFGQLQNFSDLCRGSEPPAPLPQPPAPSPRPSGGRSFPAISKRSWASQSQLTVALGKITKSPKPVLSADRDWEVRLDNAYTSVYHDTKTNVTSIWYNSLINYSTSVGGLSTGTGPQPPCHTPIPCSKVPCTPAVGQKYRGVNCTGDEFASAHGIRPRVGEASETGLLYARSTDLGESFEKPALGEVEWGGSKQNNLVMRHMGGGVITYDDRAALFRMFGRPFDGIEGPTPGQAWWASGMPGISSSVDGISGWSLVDSSSRFLNQTLPINWDTMSQLVWNEARGEWMGISRVPPAPGYRAIGITRSKGSLHNFTRAVQVLNGSKCNAPPRCRSWYNLSCTDCSTIYNAYSMVSWPWHSGYLAFVAIFHPDCRPVVLKGRPCERVETLLAWSDDSVEWTILSDDPAQLADTPFIPLGPKGSFDSTIIFGGAVPFTHNDQVHIFYSAGKQHSPNALVRLRFQRLGVRGR